MDWLSQLDNRPALHWGIRTICLSSATLDVKKTPEKKLSGVKHLESVGSFPAKNFKMLQANIHGFESNLPNIFPHSECTTTF